MAGAVDDPTKKARAAELLALAATARARRAESHVGELADVLFESRLADGRWVGHAADYVSVAATAPTTAPVDTSLVNAIGRVAVDGIDPGAGDRAVGRILSVTRPPARPSSLARVSAGVTDGR